MAEPWVSIPLTSEQREQYQPIIDAGWTVRSLQKGKNNRIQLIQPNRRGTQRAALRIRSKSAERDTK